MKEEYKDKTKEQLINELEKAESERKHLESRCIKIDAITSIVSNLKTPDKIHFRS